MSFLLRRHRPSNRRGSLYLSVMSAAMIISAIGMSAMVVARLNLRSVGWRQDRREARLLADGAVELGTAIVAQAANWRTSLLNGQEYPSTPLPMGSGTIAWRLDDPDGDLSDDNTDTVRLYGIGRVGHSVYTKSVLLEPISSGLTSLETSLHSGGNLNRSGDFDITTNQMVSANGNINNSSGPGGIIGNTWAVEDIDGNVTGAIANLQSPAKEMPDPTTVFDYYVTNGTQIAASNIPMLTIDKQLISPVSNPFGTSTNTLGIYVIDCEGNDIVIKDSQILGTLVLLNAGSGSNINMDIHWEAAVPNYPALMVQGDLKMSWHGEHNLHESLNNMSFNSIAPPHQSSKDADQVGPPIIKGLVYITGGLTIDGGKNPSSDGASHSNAWRGSARLIDQSPAPQHHFSYNTDPITHECILQGAVVIGGNAIVDDMALTLMYDPTFLGNPPPGFQASNVMTISPGSWRREVSQ
ncbi:MAG: hypothetical protein MK171_03715 [Pirellulales bacterium]|nr:hypothetical protein [Pirellulales bacterium]